MTGYRAVGAMVLVVLAAGLGAWVLLRGGPAPERPALPKPRARPPSAAEYEPWARQEFQRRHPGEKPLNWKIGAKAEEFSRLRPMGRFDLNKNDCSDYVDSIIDDALGAQARFRRHSNDHLLPRQRIWDIFYWDGRAPLQPGDEISVRHSPWYEPYESPLWHVGVIGADGMVYDWTKLQGWTEARYGRHSVEWFVRHSPDRDEVLVLRLAPQYRYAISPLSIR